jgi:hypothetical protein
VARNNFEIEKFSTFSQKQLKNNENLKKILRNFSEKFNFIENFALVSLQKPDI